MLFSKKSIFHNFGFIAAFVFVVSLSFFALWTTPVSAALCTGSCDTGNVCADGKSKQFTADTCSSGTTCCVTTGTGLSCSSLNPGASCTAVSDCPSANRVSGGCVAPTIQCCTAPATALTCASQSASGASCKSIADCGTGNGIAGTGCPSPQQCCRGAAPPAGSCIAKGGTGCAATCPGTSVTASDCTGTTNKCCVASNVGDTCASQGGTGCAATCPGTSVTASDCTGTTNKCCTNGAASTSSQSIVFTNPLVYDTVDAMLTQILGTLQRIIVVLALVFIVIGAIIYITSAGNDGQMKLAKGAITAAMIGLAIGIAAPSFLKEIGEVLGWGQVNNSLPPETKTLTEIAMNILQFLLSIVGVLGIIMLVVGGIMYLTAAGDEDRIDTGKKIVTYAIIGIAVALAALVIVTQIAALFA